MKANVDNTMCFPVRPWLLAGLLAAILWLSVSRAPAQVYFDNAWQYSEFVNEGDFHFNPVQHRYSLTVGVIVYQKEDGLLHTGIDFSGVSRVFHRTWYDSEYQYSFFGFKARPYVGIEPVNNLKLEAGLALAAYGQRLEENGVKKTLGPGFQRGDWGPFLRTEYYFHPNFAVGFSATRWLVPMLHYREIDDFGAFLPEKKRIETIDYAVFLRVQIANFMKR